LLKVSLIKLKGKTNPSDKSCVKRHLMLVSEQNQHHKNAMTIGEAIFHITHIDNLPRVLGDNGLWCDNERKRRNIITRGIAYEAIKERRERRPVPTSRKGYLADYVPFYFAPRSPMLGAIHMGKIEGYKGGQQAVLHLVSKIEDVVESGIPFTFTNGHAEMIPTEFYEDTENFSQIDWPLMRSQYWNDTDVDTNRKWRRQAEFLVYNKFPLELIAGIGVISKEVQSEVQQILDKAGKQIKVAVCSSWYY
jgi:hypothetical protein